MTQTPRAAILSPRAHAALSAELRALQKDNDALLDCLRQITRCTKIRGPLAAAGYYIIEDELMQSAQRLIAVAT
jgi:hypothetical protein